MRKLLITLLLFVAVATFTNAQTRRIEPDSITAALTGCERSQAARYTDETGQSWPVFLSADQQEIFYVKTIAGEFTVAGFEFITIERRVSWKTKPTPSTASN